MPRETSQASDPPVAPGTPSALLSLGVVESPSADLGWPGGGTYSAFFDGGAQPVGGSKLATKKMGGAGAIIYDDQTGAVVWSGGHYLPAGMGTGINVTNNAAEHSGLLWVLKQLQFLNPSKVSIWGDSALVINQVLGNNQTIAPNLRPYAQESMRLLASLRSKLGKDKAKLSHFKRANNGAADDLASLAMHLQRDFSQWFPKSEAICFAAGTDDRIQQRHCQEGLWDERDPNGVGAPQARLNRRKSHVPAVPANCLPSAPPLG